MVGQLEWLHESGSTEAENDRYETAWERLEKGQSVMLASTCIVAERFDRREGADERLAKVCKQVDKGSICCWLEFASGMEARSQ